MPGNELRDYLPCAAAKAQGSGNWAGICDPAVDALVERVVNAQDRRTLTTAARSVGSGVAMALVPGSELGQQIFHVAYWDRFGHPDKPIRQGFNFDTWWVDPAKSAAMKRRSSSEGWEQGSGRLPHLNGSLSHPSSAAGHSHAVRHHRDQLCRGADLRLAARSSR